MRVVGYARLSRASREESTSIVRQREIIERTCDARGFQLVEIIEDNDVSATKTRLNRPGLDRVRRLVAERSADAVMVWRLDRLARNVGDISTLLDEGLQVISATENLDTTSAMGRAMVEILQVFASMEAKTTGVRVSASREYLRRNGRFPGGPIPYGYRAIPHPDGVGRALEIQPEEAAVIRRVAAEVLDGSSVYAACARLNAEGVKPRYAKTWSATTLQRILRSNSILGRVTISGELLRDDATGLPVAVWAPVLSVGEVERLRYLTDWTPTPGRSEATKLGRRQRASRLLSGLLHCPGCGGTLIAKNRRNTSGQDIYACGARARGQHCPGGVAVECERVEAEVARQFLAAVGRLEVVEPRVFVREDAEIATVDESIRETTDQLRRPDTDFDGLVERLTKLRAERERLTALPTEPVVEMVETGRTFAEHWQAIDTMKRRDLLLQSGVEVGLERAAQRGKWDPRRVSLEFR